MYDLAYIIEKIEAAGYRVERAPRDIPRASALNHGGYEIFKPGAGVVAGFPYDFYAADLEEWARQQGLIP